MHTAAMSRITGVTLLLIILVDVFYGSAASHAGFQVTKVHLRKCRCRVFPNGKIKCRYPLFPTNHVDMQSLIKCLCSKTNQHKFQEFQAACNKRGPATLLPLGHM